MVIIYPLGETEALRVKQTIYFMGPHHRSV